MNLRSPAIVAAALLVGAITTVDILVVGRRVQAPSPADAALFDVGAPVTNSRSAAAPIAEAQPQEDRGRALPETEAREIIGRALGGFDFERGFRFTLSDGFGPPRRLATKDVGGTRCFRLETAMGRSSSALLRNADGYWFLAKTGAIQVNFMEDLFSRILNGVARDVAAAGPISGAHYSIETVVGPAGAPVRRITETFSSERQALAARAAAHLHLPSEMIQASVLRQELPNRTVYCLDATGKALVAQYQLNAAGKRVGPAAAYDPPGAPTVDDTEFRIPASMPIRIARNSADLKRFLQAPAP